MAAPLPLIPIAPEDLQPGVPTRVDLLDARGNLLLRCGGVVSQAERVEQLTHLARKVSTAANEAKAGMEFGNSNRLPVFSRVEEMASQLAQLERSWGRGECEQFVPRVENLARRLLTYCDADGDAALAQPHLDCHHSYSPLHHLLAAVVGLRLSKALDWDTARRLSLATAALTHDIALLPHRQLLEHEAPLSDAERQLMKSHPEDGLTLLLSYGVRDHMWLRIVREHQETLCGDGYPRGLSGDDLCEEVRVMSLADAYSAMLRPRPHRSRKLAPEVLDDLMLHAGHRYDARLVDLLIRELGIFPPGSVLRLNNQEIAVTVRNNPKDLHAPQIMSVRASNGRPFLHPVARDPNQENFSIINVLPPETCFALRKQVAEIWSSETQ